MSMVVEARYTALSLVDEDEAGDDSSTRQVHLTSDNKELVATSAQQRNWRGIAIALLVILIVCALIITAVVIATPRENLENLGEKFTFDDYIKGELRPAVFTAQWIPGTNQFLYQTANLDLKVFNCSTNTSFVLMDNMTISRYHPKEFKLSADGRYLLLKHKITPIYRHTTKAEYAVYNLSSRDNPKPLKLSDGSADSELEYVTWSPTGHSLVIVKDNNIFYKPDVEAKAIKLTTSGIPRQIYNGVPDWVYEEEILGTDNAIWWSPQSTYLLYASFNDTMVPKFHVTKYGQMDKAYTEDEEIAYPKAGHPNPNFTLYVVRLSTRKEIQLIPPVEFTGWDYYFTTVVWRNDEEVMVTWMNRTQTFAIQTICSANNGTCNTSIEIKAESGWLDLFIPPIVSSNGSHYFWILSSTDADPFKHVVMVEVRKNSQDQLHYLTHGKWDVSKLVGFDEETQRVYFMSPEDDPRQMHMFSTSVHSKGNDPRCETRKLDEKCRYNQVSMATTGDFYVWECLGPGIPRYSLMTKDGIEVERLENNSVFAENIAKKALPWIKYELITLANGEQLWGKMLLPPVLKEEEILTYPLVLHVYGGPGTQMVTEKYSIDWHTYMTSSREVIYAFVDGRGSSGRGDKFLHAVYKSLGKYEVDDTLKAAEYFGKIPYVDAGNMAIWGWSYGGYLTASALSRGTNTFKCGIAVAPVTDWIYYDSVYTERYMGLPSGDNQHYKNANVSDKAVNFRKSLFMLIHGTADDNVHFQQSAQLIKALTEADVYFRLQIYPDKHHGLIGGNTRKHLYETMEDFIIECFQGLSEKFDHESQEYVKKPLASWQKKKKMN